MKNAVCFAIAGTAAWTILTAVDFVRAIIGVTSGYLPLLRLLTSFIPFVAALSLLVFFIVFRRSQS